MQATRNCSFFPDGPFFVCCPGGILRIRLTLLVAGTEHYGHHRTVFLHHQSASHNPPPPSAPPSCLSDNLTSTSMLPCVIKVRQLTDSILASQYAAGSGDDAACPVQTAGQCACETSIVGISVKCVVYSRRSSWCARYAFLKMLPHFGHRCAEFITCHRYRSFE
jgi:hypothetical protein